MAIIITGIFCLVAAIIFFVLGILQLNEKGPVMNNTWLYASDKEREQIDKKFCYRQAGVTFIIAGGIFLLNAAPEISSVSPHALLLYTKFIQYFKICFIFLSKKSVQICSSSHLCMASLPSSDMGNSMRSSMVLFS